MMANSLNLTKDLTPVYYDVVEFQISGYSLEELIPIIYPHQINESDPHYIVKNGHYTHHSDSSQQYYCKYCHCSFYVHNSRVIINLNQVLRNSLQTRLKGAKLNSGTIINCKGCSKSTATRILYKILGNIPKSSKFKDLRSKHRNSSVLMIDETFLNICKKT